MIWEDIRHEVHIEPVQELGLLDPREPVPECRWVEHLLEGHGQTGVLECYLYANFKAHCTFHILRITNNQLPHILKRQASNHASYSMSRNWTTHCNSMLWKHRHINKNKKCTRTKQDRISPQIKMNMLPMMTPVQTVPLFLFTAFLKSRGISNLPSPDG